MEVMSEHVCKTAVINCIDFRFQKAIAEFIENNSLMGDHDRISIAGAGKDMDYIVGQLKISKRLHHISEVWLIHHQDCGAYGLGEIAEDAEIGVHKSDMTKLAERIKMEVDGELKVRIFFAKLTGQVEELI